MLHRLATEESERSETDTLDDTPRTSMSDINFDLNDRQPSMSSVFSTGSQKPSSRSSSPSGSRSPSHHRKPSFPLPFRKSSTNKSLSGSSNASDHEKKKEDGLCRWLRDGTVIYKSVGLGLMDLVVGMQVVKYAKEKGVGAQVEGF